MSILSIEKYNVLYHRLAHLLVLIILALAVGVVYVAPQWVILAKLQMVERPYVLIQTTHHSDETNVYMSRAREVYDGHWPARDFYFDQDLPSVFPALPSLLMGGFVHIAKGNVNLAYLSATFVFSALIFLLFYVLGRVVIGNRWWSLLVGLTGVLTPIALHLPRAFMSPVLFSDIVIKNFFPLVRTNLDKLFFGRIDDPLITYIFYVPAIIALVWFWRKPSWSKAVLAGLTAGLLFNVYFHYAFYWLTVIALLFIYVLVFRYREIRLTKYVLVISVITVLVATPYLLEYFRFRLLPWSQDYVWRIGVEIGRGFRFASVKFDYLVYVILAGMIYILLWRRTGGGHKRDQAVLFWLFLLAIIVVWNIQLVTGFVPHPGHWRKAISPIIFVIVLTLLGEFSSGLLIISGKKLRSLIMITAIISSVLLLSKKAVNVYKFYELPANSVAGYTFNSNLVNSWNWINSSLESESRIISDSFLTSVYLGVYTSARPFLAIGGNTPVPNYLLEENYLSANKFFNISEKQLRQRLAPSPNSNQGSIFLDDPFYLYSSYWREKSFDYAFTSSDKSIPEHKIDELITRYNALKLDHNSIKADYLYFGPWEKELTAQETMKSDYELAYLGPEIKIYKIK